MDAYPVLKTEILNRSRNDHSEACQHCGFVEPSLIAWRKIDAEEIWVTCRECHAHHDLFRYADEFVAIWLPAYPIRAVSFISKMLPFSMSLPLSSKIHELVKEPYPNAVKKKVRDAIAVEALNCGLKDQTSIGPKVTTVLNEIAAPIGLAIAQAKEIFSTNDVRAIGEVMTVMTDPERQKVEFGLRLIPKAISKVRVDSWHEHSIENVSKALITQLITDLLDPNDFAPEPSQSVTLENDEAELQWPPDANPGLEFNFSDD